MSLFQEIHTAAKTYVPPEKPLVEMHPMTKMMMKAMDVKEPKSKEEKPKQKKKLSDYLKIKAKVND